MKIRRDYRFDKKDIKILRFVLIFSILNEVLFLYLFFNVKINFGTNSYLIIYSLILLLGYLVFAIYMDRKYPKRRS